MALTLWSKDGSLIVDNIGNAIICEVCPCEGVTVSIQCPTALHTLGSHKLFKATVTYDFPNENNTLPNISFALANPEFANTLYIRDKHGQQLLLGQHWGGQAGDTTRTLEIDITAVGHIPLNAGDAPAVVNVVVTHPDEVDEDGIPIPLDACVILVYDRVTCEVETYPGGDICDGDLFDAVIEVSGLGYSEILSKLDDEHALFPTGRFEIDLVGADIPVDSGWQAGHWRANEIQHNTGVEEVTIGLLEWGTYGLCGEGVNILPCKVTNITLACPDNLHTLGSAEDINIAVAYTDIAKYSVLPDIEIYDRLYPNDPYPGVLIDDNTNLPVDFTKGWITVESNLLWVGKIRVDNLPSEGKYEHEREIDIVIKITHPKYRNNAGNLIVTDCEIKLNDKTQCDVEIVPTDTRCPGDTFEVEAEIKGTYNEVLTRIDSIEYPGLFGTQNRFNLIMEGPYEVKDNRPSVKRWENGIYNGPLYEILKPEENEEAEDITAAIEEYGEEICDDTFTPAVCTMDADIVCPNNGLHVLGPAKRLKITISYTAPDHYNPFPIIKLINMDTGDDWHLLINPIFIEDIEGNPRATFGIEEWVSDVETKDLVWDHDIYINDTARDGRVLRVLALDYEKDENGNNIELARCDIPMYERVECEVTLPQTICINHTVTGSISAVGINGDALERMTGTMYPRFDVRLTGGGISIIPLDFYLNSAWDKGEWECTEITPNSFNDNPLRLELYDRTEENYNDEEDGTLCYEEADVEECGFDVSLSCPSSLHTLADAQELKITLAYTDPDLYAPHPRISFVYPDGDPHEEIKDKDAVNNALTFSDSSPNWTWQGDNRVWAGSIYITSINNENHRAVATLEVRHPVWDEDAQEYPLITDCDIKLTTIIECTATLPSDKCHGDKFDISIDVEGENGEVLTKFNPSPGSSTRFSISGSGLTLPEGVGFYSGWVNGKWSANNVTGSVGEITLSLYDRLVDYSCSDTMNIYDCSLDAEFTECPETVHIYGDPKDIELKVVYNKFSLYSEFPDIVVGGDIVVTESSWTLSGSTRTWKAKVEAKDIFAFGEGTIEVYPPDDDEEPLAECVIEIDADIVCEVEFSEDELYVGDTFDVTITTEGSNGDELTKLTSGVTDVFGAGKRFNVNIEGEYQLPAGFNINGAWDKGIWKCEGIEAIDEGMIKVELLDLTTVLCGEEVEVTTSGVLDIDLTCPTGLHTLGDSEYLKIEIVYENAAAYSILPDIGIYDADTLNDLDGPRDLSGYIYDEVTGLPVNFTTGWSEQGDVFTWNKKVKINNIPTEADTGESRSQADVRIIVSHPEYVDDYGIEIEVTCDVLLNDETECNISINMLSGTGSPGSTFNVVGTVTGTEGEYLKRVDDSTNPGLFMYPARFRVAVDGPCEVTGNTSSSWTTGTYTSSIYTITNWTIGSDGSFPKIEAVLKEWDEDHCDDTKNLSDGGHHAVVSCPSSLHTLGAAKQLEITYVTPDDTIPIIDIDGELLNENGGVLYFGEGAWTGTRTKKWTGNVRVDNVSGGDSQGDITIIVRHPIVMENGEHKELDRCTIVATDEVSCSINAPNEVCEGVPFSLSVLLVGALTGETLYRLDSSKFSSFFSVNTIGSLDFPEGCSFYTGWDSGEWSCSGVKVPDADYMEITVQVVYGDYTKEAYIVLQEGFSVRFTKSPDMLHVYGGYEELEIRAEDECIPLDISDYNIFTVFYIDGESKNIDAYMQTSTGGLSFSSGWVNGVWSKRVGLKGSLPFSEGKKDCLIEIELTFEHKTNPSFDPIIISTSIYCSIELLGNITIFPRRVHEMAAFETKMEITDVHGNFLERLPASGGVSIDHGPVEEGTEALLVVGGWGSPGFLFYDGVCNIDDLYITKECTYYFKMTQTVGGFDTEIGYEYIVVDNGELDKQALIEAINERLDFASKPLLDEDSSLNTIRSRFNFDCRTLFLYKISAGEYVFYLSSELPSLPIEPPAGSSQEDWEAFEIANQKFIYDLYTIVCTCIYSNNAYFRVKLLSQDSDRSREGAGSGKQEGSMEPPPKKCCGEDIGGYWGGCATESLSAALSRSEASLRSSYCASKSKTIFSSADYGAYSFRRLLRMYYSRNQWGDSAFMKTQRAVIEKTAGSSGHPGTSIPFEVEIKGYWKDNEGGGHRIVTSPKPLLSATSAGSASHITIIKGTTSVGIARVLGPHSPSFPPRLYPKGSTCDGDYPDDFYRKGTVKIIIGQVKLGFRHSSE